MGLSSTFLVAKALALSLMNLSARMSSGPRASSGTGSDQWNSVLDSSIELYKNLSSSGPDGASQAYNVIFPGTLWCGQGSKAKTFDELGVFAGPDRCCRDHDHCPDSISTHETKHGLYNDHQFASALCACDHKFLQCLRTDASVIAREVGRLYFDFLDPVCFTYDYPVAGCRRTEKPGGVGRCVEYAYDTSRRPEWHFEDFPFHYGSASVASEVDISSEAAAALAGQERPDAAANGEDAELWHALLMNRHVRFGTHYAAAQHADGDANANLDVADKASADWAGVIGEQVFPGAD